MHYQPATIPADHAASVSGLLVLAADVYATASGTRDSIAEAADRIDWGHDPARRERIVRAAEAAAVNLAASRKFRSHTGWTWAQVQAVETELWPILADAATAAARHESAALTPGRWTI